MPQFETDGPPSPTGPVPGVSKDTHFDSRTGHDASDTSIAGTPKRATREAPGWGEGVRAEALPSQALPTAGPRGSTLPAVPGYEILGELGRGSMGVVYKARQVNLNRLVALKMIRPGAGIGGEVLGRFVEEARLVASLQHPNIVQIYE